MTAIHRHSAGTTEETAPWVEWDEIAAGYDRFVAPQEAALANEALGLAGLKPGQSFLDVAAGTGGLSLPAARLGARVLATDWSPVMIEQFRARVRDEGLQDAEGRVMDCHALHVEDNTFDVTGSQFGVMLVPDQPQALREMVRVTKLCGKVLFIAYGPPAELEFLNLFISAIHAVDPDFSGVPGDSPPLEFQAADAEVLSQRLTDAGLRGVTVQPGFERAAFRTGQDMWDWVLYGNPLAGKLVGGLSDDQRSTLRGVLDGMLRERADARGVAIVKNRVNIGIGTK